MPYTSANPMAEMKTRRLIYYIIIDGKSEYSACFSYHREQPDAFVELQQKIVSFAVIHKGIVFKVYDQPPFANRDLVTLIFDDVLNREGLVGE